MTATTVTLDLDFYVPFLVEYLRGTLGDYRSLNSEQRECLTEAADQIEAQLPEPKPEEPTGLGAVVEDDRGERYVRLGTAYSPWFGGRYIPSVGQQRPWSDINAVRVLSEGVS